MDVMHDMNQVAIIIENARAKLSAQIKSAKNIKGCLKGTIDDYLEPFNAQIAKMKA